MGNWRRWGLSCFVALALLCGNQVADAQDVLPKAGTWEFGLRTGYIWGLRKHAEMVPINLRVGYTLFKGQWWIIPAGALEVSAEPFVSVIHSIRPGGTKGVATGGVGGTVLIGADLMGYNDPRRFKRQSIREDAHGSIELGLGLPVFTYYFDTGTRLAPYIEGGLGLLYTDLRGYNLGGHFSFMENIGLGVSYFLSDDLAFNAMWRYRHVSNANLYDENAGLDSSVILAGFSYFLPQHDTHMLMLLPPLRERRVIDRLLSSFFHEHKASDFRQAISRLCIFYRLKRPRFEWYAYIDWGKTAGRTYEDGTIHLMHPEYWKRGRKYNSERQWVNMIYHEMGHYIYWVDAERKANAFAQNMVRGLNPQRR